MSIGEPPSLQEIAQGQANRVFELDAVSGQTVVKVMGRMFSAVAVDDEVVIADVTDITRPVSLGVARGRRADGSWQIVGRRNHDVLTTDSLLSAAIALWQEH